MRRVAERGGAWRERKRRLGSHPSLTRRIGSRILRFWERMRRLAARGGSGGNGCAGSVCLAARLGPARPPRLLGYADAVGRRTSNSVRPGREATAIRPPWLSTIAFTIARPRPVVPTSPERA